MEQSLERPIEEVKPPELMHFLWSLILVLAIIGLVKYGCGHRSEDRTVERLSLFENEVTLVFDSEKGQVFIDNQGSTTIVVEAVLELPLRPRTLTHEVKPHKTWLRLIAFERLRSVKVCKLDRSTKRVWSCRTHKGAR